MSPWDQDNLVPRESRYTAQNKAEVDGSRAGWRVDHYGPFSWLVWFGIF